MTCKRLLTLALLALLTVPWAAADAGWRTTVVVGGPVYYRPCYPYYPYRVYVGGPPVVVVPGPVYAPAPVYVQPAPVYVQAPPANVQPVPMPTPVTPQPGYQALPPQPVPSPVP
jgi:hypothetical protein